MTRDTKKFLEIARICAVLAQSAPTSKERETFVTLAETWRAMATTAGNHEQFHPTGFGKDARSVKRQGRHS